MTSKEQPTNLKFEKKKKSAKTIEKLTAELEFATSQIERLENAGSMDQNLLNFLEEKKRNALEALAKLKEK